MSIDREIQLKKEKIDKLNQEAWDVRVYNSPKSFQLSQESVKLARSINYKKGLAHGTQSLGFCYVRRSENQEALPLLEESLALFESLDDIIGQSCAYEYMTIIQRGWGKFGRSLELGFKALELIERTTCRENQSTILYQIGVTYKHLGNFEKALEYQYKSLSIHREMDNKLFQSYPINIIGSIYFENGDFPRALEYYREGLAGRQESNDQWGEAGSLDNIGFTYFKLKDYEQAIEYCTKSLSISKITGDKRGQANAMLHLAEVYKETDDKAQAVALSNQSMQLRKESGDKRGETEILLFLANLNAEQSTEENDYVLQCLTASLIIAEELKALDLLSKAHSQLFSFHKKKGNYEKAMEHLELHSKLEKELHRNTVNQKIENLEITHKAEEAKKESDAIKKRNDELTKLNSEIEKQKEKLEQTLKELKATQSQLIQSEKMASLGELTAGIAHEIQNPLNFVNNFSEVNKELLVELKDEIKKGNLDEVNAIANDVISNEEKINHHGKRADAIVKGMLQHSRTSSGQKEPTDINALADEYLRLAYHGLRAKDKLFNATLKTDFDESIGNINIIPQDIGRVILNIFTNAFYAVNKKKNEAGENYEPTVTVKTSKIPPSGGGGTEIQVTDNGNGIPAQLIDKIFQPFFTTKPTGEGTGLGLSLSYDIITKGHNGELKVDTQESEGTTFTIYLPI
jgi:signal transduction histidine kinase